MSNEICREAPVETIPTPGADRLRLANESGAFAFLSTNSEAYESLVREIQMAEQKGEHDRALDKIVQAALCATLSHAGRFADGAIENIALRIGARLEDANGETMELTPPAAGKKRRRILHVLTHVMAIGGHTRMARHWIEHDQESCHSVLLLDQKGTPVPSWLSQAVRGSGGSLVVVPGEWKIIRKAQLLRSVAKRGADLVVLHHHCWDVVPTVAFAVEDCPPVAVLNHADHLFWLGSSVADMVINLRTPGATHSAERRSIALNSVLPVPLVDRECAARESARESLKIAHDVIMLLSIGRAEKYRPCGSYDFIATAGRILEQLPDAHFYVVGLSLSDLAPALRGRVHERLHLVGTIEDPAEYRAAADVYLESFPFGSQTALLESALCGLPVVPAYAPLSPLLVANDDAVQDLIPSPRNEQEYIDRVKLLVQQPAQRATLGAALRERLLHTHVEHGWLAQLATLYRQTDGLVHRPSPIPTSKCETTETDIGLSLWHAMSRSSDARGSGDGALAAALCSVASVARQIGCYAMARRFAWRAVWLTPGNLRCWRLLVLTYMGRTAKLVRKASRRSA